MTIRPKLRALVLAAGYATSAQAQTAAPAADPLDTLLATAEHHHRAGRLQEANRALAAAENAARRAGSAAAQARAWTLSGTVRLTETTAMNTGYAEADTAAARALRFAEQAKDPRLLADAHELTGRVLYSRRINLAQGDYAEPSDHFRRSLELRQQVGDTRGVIESLFRVGLIHERKGEDAEAFDTYQRAWRMAGDRYPLERSNLARHLAYQHQRRGDLDEALELFQESLRLREEAGFELTRAPALTSIGDLYREKKDHERALDYGRRALTEAQRVGAKRFVVLALISVGETLAASSRTQQAVEHLRRAETTASEIGYVSGERQARRRLAEIDKD